MNTSASRTALRRSRAAASWENHWQDVRVCCDNGMAESVRGVAGVVTAIVSDGPAFVYRMPSAGRGECDVRRISCDQFEFDPPDSEQSLELALSDPRQHQALRSLLAECGASANPGTPPEP